MLLPQCSLPRYAVHGVKNTARYPARIRHIVERNQPRLFKHAPRCLVIFPDGCPNLRQIENLKTKAQCGVAEFGGQAAPPCGCCEAVAQIGPLAYRKLPERQPAKTNDGVGRFMQAQRPIAMAVRMPMVIPTRQHHHSATVFTQRTSRIKCVGGRITVDGKQSVNIAFDYSTQQQARGLYGVGCSSPYKLRFGQRFCHGIHINSEFGLKEVLYNEFVQQAAAQTLFLATYLQIPTCCASIRLFGGLLVTRIRPQILPRAAAYQALHAGVDRSGGSLGRGGDVMQFGRIQRFEMHDKIC